MYSPQTPENNAFELGHRYYELSNHLGNVLTVISDVKTRVSSGGNVASYTANIVNIADYSPFGVQLDGRTITSDRYRYGFQGQEKDDEVKGEGNSVNYKYRMHDPRVGRFFAVDPLASKFPQLSTYQFAGNKPIWSREIEGLESEKDAEEANKIENQNPTLLGQQKSDGSFNGVQQIEAVSVVADRNTGDIIPAPEKPKKGNWSVTFNINGTEISKKGLSYRQKENALAQFEILNEKLTEARLREQRQNWSFWDPLDWPDANVEYPSILPDAVSIDFEFNAFAGPGTNTTFSLNWILKGPEASPWPVGTITSTVGGGFDVSGGVGLTAHYKHGGYLRPLDFQTTKSSNFSLIDRGLKSSLSLSMIAHANFNYTRTPTGDSGYINSYGLGFGGSATPTIINGYSGVPTSTVLFGGD